MSGRILPLSEVVRSQLRSGITITSVAQCVEELVLNSLDAEATCIAVRIDFGIFRIQVVDNGHGVQERDLKNLGKRHATSKCHTLEDLNINLSHYGFRGEALASTVDISAIVDICTKPRDTDHTLTKLFTYGKEKIMGPAKTSRPSVGTTVTIQDFMYNMPVRRKIIKEAIDSENVRKRLESFALMHPKVSFSLRNDNKNAMILQTKKTNSYVSTFMQLFGTEKAQGLAEVEHSLDQFTISGYISTQAHINKAIQFVYVNKRLILKTKIHKMLNWLLARSSIISSRIHPGSVGSGKPTSPIKGMRLYGIFFLNIECPHSEYDICLDPTKTLVEFRDWDKLFICIEELILKFIREEDLVISLSERFRRSGKGNEGEEEDVEEGSLGTSQLGVFSLKRMGDKGEAPEASGPKYGRSICTEDNLLAVHSLPVKRARKKIFEPETFEQYTEYPDKHNARELRSCSKKCKSPDKYKQIYMKSTERTKTKIDSTHSACKSDSSSPLSTKRIRKSNVNLFEDVEESQKSISIGSEDRSSNDNSVTSIHSSSPPPRLDEPSQINDKMNKGDSERDNNSITVEAASREQSTLEQFKQNINIRLCDSDESPEKQEGEKDGAVSDTAPGPDTAVDGNFEQGIVQGKPQTKTSRGLTTLEEFVRFCKADQRKAELEKNKTPADAVRYTPSTPPPLRASRRTMKTPQGKDNYLFCESITVPERTKQILDNNHEKEETKIFYECGIEEDQYSNGCSNILTVDDYQESIMQLRKDKNKEESVEHSSGRKTSSLSKSLGEKFKKHQSQVETIQTLQKYEYCRVNTEPSCMQSTFKCPVIDKAVSSDHKFRNRCQEPQKVDRTLNKEIDRVWGQQEEICSARKNQRIEHDTDILESSFRFQPVITGRTDGITFDNEGCLLDNPVYAEISFSDSIIPIGCNFTSERHTVIGSLQGQLTDSLRCQPAIDLGRPTTPLDATVSEGANPDSNMEKRKEFANQTEKQVFPGLKGQNESQRLEAVSNINFGNNNMNSIPENSTIRSYLEFDSVNLMRSEHQSFMENGAQSTIPEPVPNNQCLQQKAISNHHPFCQGINNHSKHPEDVTKSVRTLVTVEGRETLSSATMSSASCVIPPAVSSTQPFEVDGTVPNRETINYGNLLESQGFITQNLNDKLEKPVVVPEKSATCETSEHTLAVAQDPSFTHGLCSKDLGDITDLLSQIENPELSEPRNVNHAHELTQENVSASQVSSYDITKCPRKTSNLMENFTHSTPICSGVSKVQQEYPMYEAEENKEMANVLQKDVTPTSSPNPFSESLHFSQLTLAEQNYSLPSNGSSSTVHLLEKTDSTSASVSSAPTSSDSGSEKMKQKSLSREITFHGKMIHIGNQLTSVKGNKDESYSDLQNDFQSVSTFSSKKNICSVPCGAAISETSEIHKGATNTEVTKGTDKQANISSSTEGSNTCIAHGSPTGLGGKENKRSKGQSPEEHNSEYHHPENPDSQCPDTHHTDEHHPKCQNPDSQCPDTHHTDEHHPKCQNPDSQCPDTHHTDEHHPKCQNPDSLCPDTHHPKCQNPDSLCPDTHYTDEHHPKCQNPDSQCPDTHHPKCQNPDSLCPDTHYTDEHHPKCQNPDSQCPDTHHPKCQNPDSLCPDTHYTDEHHPKCQNPDSLCPDTHHPKCQNPDSLCPDTHYTDEHHPKCQNPDSLCPDTHHPKCQNPDSQCSDEQHPECQKADSQCPKNQQRDSQYSEGHNLDHPARRWKEAIDKEGRKIYVDLQTGNTSYNPLQVEDTPEWICSQSLGAPLLKVPLTHEPWFLPRGSGRKTRVDFSLTHGFTDFLSWKKTREVSKELNLNFTPSSSTTDSVSKNYILNNIEESGKPLLNEEGSHLKNEMQETNSVLRDLENGNNASITAKYSDEFGLSDVAQICHTWKAPDFAMDAEVLNSGAEQITAAERNITTKRDAIVKVYNAVHPYRFTKDMLQTCKVLGQVDNKYIACSLTYPWLAPDAFTSTPTQLVVLFDQHAAHERVRLEAITRDNYEKGESGQGGESKENKEEGGESCVATIRSATVSPPLQLSLPRHEVRLMVAFPHIFTRRGLHFSQINSEMVSFHAIPSCLVAREASEARHRRCQMAATTVESTVRDLCHTLQCTGGIVPPIPTPISNVLNSQACRGAVKFGDPLSLEQCQELVCNLASCQLPFQCAHGRPSIMPLINLAHLPPSPNAHQRNKPCLWKLKEALKDAG